MPITWSCASLSLPWNQPELSLSELANGAEIEIVSACGGKSICSTCKVQVKEGGEFLSRRSDAEERIAQRLKWDDSIRLSCATKQISDGTVVLKRLIKPPGEKKRERRLAMQKGLGSIRPLAILFTDLKGFTPLSEQLPAFDLVYVLNRYFSTLKATITKHGGVINLWVGDEMSCVFGLEKSDNKSYGEDAVNCALEIRDRIQTLSKSIEKEFSINLDVGIGIHFGDVVVGNIGPADDLKFGLVGEAVNVASRIERKTRDHQCDILISETVYKQISLEKQQFKSVGEIPLKGVSQSITHYKYSPKEKAIKG